MSSILNRAVFEIFDFEKCCDLEIRVTNGQTDDGHLSTAKTALAERRAGSKELAHFPPLYQTPPL